MALCIGKSGSERAEYSRRVIHEHLSWENYKMIEEISKGHDSKYLTKKERNKLTTFLSSYKNVCSYNYSSVCAESLFSYFRYKLEQNNIDIKIEPIFFDGEIVDYDEPRDLFYLKHDLANIFKNYDPNIFKNYDPKYDELYPLVNKVTSLFSDYCKEYFIEEEINYFDDFTLDEVLKKSHIRKEWNEKLYKYKLAKENFLNLKVFENN